MPKENIALDVDKWDVYKIIDFTVAFILVVISMVSADIPRQRIQIVKKPAPPSYGPPQVEATTTEMPTTTENLATQPEKLEGKAPEGKLYAVLPQGQRLVYAVQPEKVEDRAPEDKLYAVLPQGQRLVYAVPSEKLGEKAPEDKLYAVLPQGQRLVYAVPSEKVEDRTPEDKQYTVLPQGQRLVYAVPSEKLEEKAPEDKLYAVLPQGQRLVYAVPSEKLEERAPEDKLYGVLPQRVVYAVPKRAVLLAEPAKLQTLPLTAAVRSSVYTPFSASYIQIYQ